MIDVKKINSMNFSFALNSILYLPIKHSILLVGNHGIGKDEIVKKAANILGIPYIDVRLSQCDVGDIKGLPYRVNNKTIFAPPDWIPIEEEEEAITHIGKIAQAQKGILFLNEINRASKEVQQAIFELILDRKIDNRKIKRGWRIVCAVNGDEHYQVNTMDVAFKSRFFVINFKPSVEEWLEWAKNPNSNYNIINPKIIETISEDISDGIHDSIIKFIEKYPNLLDSTEEQIIQSETNITAQIPSRRSWSMLSDCIKTYEKLYSEGIIDFYILNKEYINYLLLVATGYVGTTASIEFVKYIENDYETLSGEDIINNWNKEIENKVKKIIKNGNMIELSKYSDMIINIIKKSNGKIEENQKENISNFFKILNKELRVRFYNQFIRECRDTCLDWYNNENVQKMVLEALLAPKA